MNGRVRMSVMAVVPVILSLVIAATTSAAFRITKVIEVGPGGPAYIMDPLPWSPDGTKLAYFYGGKLMVSDTLGQARTVSDRQFRARRFEWISNEEVMIHNEPFNSVDSIVSRLTVENVISGTQTAVREDTYLRRTRTGSSVDGPFLTIAGSPYYTVKTEGLREVQMVAGKGQKAMPASQARILLHSDEGLSVVSGNLTDTILFRKLRGAGHSVAAARRDLSYLMSGGVLVSLLDSSVIVLDTLIGPPPSGTGCGIGEPRFNPRFPEVMFYISCDDGHKYVVNRVGTYDYQMGSLQVLDTAIHVKECFLGSYAPDGLKLSIYAEGKVYIVSREVVK